MVRVHYVIGKALSFRVIILLLVLMSRMQIRAPILCPLYAYSLVSVQLGGVAVAELRVGEERFTERIFKANDRSISEIPLSLGG